MQSVLLRSLKRWPKISAVENLNSYMHKAVFNELLDGRKRKWRGEVPTFPIPDQPDTASDDSQAVDSVRSALLRLPIDLRSVIVLRYYVDMTEQQTSETLNIPIGTVKSRSSKAIRLLGAELNSTEPKPMERQ